MLNLLLKDKDCPIRRGILNDLDYAFLMDKQRRLLFKIPDIGTSSLPKKGANGNIEESPTVHRVEAAFGREQTIRQENIKEYQNTLKQQGIRRETIKYKQILATNSGYHYFVSNASHVRRWF